MSIQTQTNGRIVDAVKASVPRARQALRERESRMNPEDGRTMREKGEQILDQIVAEIEGREASGSGPEASMEQMLHGLVSRFAPDAADGTGGAEIKEALDEALSAMRAGGGPGVGDISGSMRGVLRETVRDGMQGGREVVEESLASRQNA